MGTVPAAVFVAVVEGGNHIARILLINSQWVDILLLLQSKILKSAMGYWLSLHRAPSASSALTVSPGPLSPSFLSFSSPGIAIDALLGLSSLD